MEMEILNKILVRVEKIGTDFIEFKQEVRERFDKNEKELVQFKNEMHEFKNEMYQFRDEMYEFKNEMYQFKDEMHEFKDEMHEFKKEVYGLFDRNIKEIADEIHEVGRMMNRKIEQVIKETKEEIRQEIKVIVEMNEKDHNIFRAEIEKLQCIAKHLPTPYSEVTEITA